MTEYEIARLVDGIGFPTAYHHFGEGQSPEPPFLVYIFPESRNASGDNRVYARIQKLHLELYTDRKDLASERKVEKKLNDAGYFWNKTESWIESESLYEVLYEMEVLINEQE